MQRVLSFARQCNVMRTRCSEPEVGNINLLAGVIKNKYSDCTEHKVLRDKCRRWHISMNDIFMNDWFLNESCQWATVNGVTTCSCWIFVSFPKSVIRLGSPTKKIVEAPKPSLNLDYHRYWLVNALSLQLKVTGSITTFFNLIESGSVIVLR